jgi:tetratricopeptide (TPR) repeat protein
MRATSRAPARAGLGLLLAAALAASAAAQSGDERLGAAEREVLAADLRRGRAHDVLSDLDEVIAELPADGALRSLRARARHELGELAGALEDARAGVEIALAAADAPAEDKAFAVRTLAGLELELGRTAEARVVLRALDDLSGAAADPRSAWLRGRAALEAGDRGGAREAFRAGAEVRAPREWEALLAQARCQRALGRLEAAGATLAAADLAARKAGGPEPEVLTEWGSVKFEGYGEVSGVTSDRESAGSLYREALRIDARHEEALLGLFELGRVNWNRSRESPGELLRTVLANRPDSIRGHLARVSFALDDGDLRSARESLARLEALAPGRRDVRTERAALLWIDRDPEGARAMLAELVRQDGADASPEREVARHLIELYRFAEALPFAEAAVERDPGDARAWKELGRAQANTGDEDAARRSLERSETAAEGRQDAWRANMRVVLGRMAKELVPHESGPLRFLWPPEGASVLAAYYVPFYLDAREELARRYGYTPDRVQIEVFQRWEDFSVRSTGFEGFPALGVCFGPVVTAVSPLSELRGQFSWARTAWHEFTHVVHLGISHNRCPRWVTEGLATWEELARRPSWTRNMRRELLDARANGAILPIRELNNAFRGQRVLFAYYQSGLLCEMLIADQGFPSMVRLLEAFDSGADLDRALQGVYRRSPEELDRAFHALVETKLAGP